MRWEALFADLEAEVAEEEAAERRSEVADRSRAEVGRLRLIDRLAPALKAPGALRVALAGHAVVGGSLRAVGSDWLLLTQDSGPEWLIALAAVQTIQGLGAASAEPGWEGLVGARLDFRVVLRRVVRDRSRVTVGLTSGDAISGRLSRVGADHVELVAEESRLGAGAGLTIPLTAVVFVQRR
jgi:hypothetical protein